MVQYSIEVMCIGCLFAEIVPGEMAKTSANVVIEEGKLFKAISSNNI
jgi:hypothetical protein